MTRSRNDLVITWNSTLRFFYKTLIKMDPLGRGTTSGLFLGRPHPKSNYVTFLLILCPPIGFVTILLTARHEELIVFRE
jgi:hypothetical protein